jgi:hypothetical protein
MIEKFFINFIIIRISCWENKLKFHQLLQHSEMRTKIWYFNFFGRFSYYLNQLSLCICLPQAHFSFSHDFSYLHYCRMTSFSNEFEQIADGDKKNQPPTRQSMKKLQKRNGRTKEVVRSSF